PYYYPYYYGYPYGYPPYGYYPPAGYPYPPPGYSDYPPPSSGTEYPTEEAPPPQSGPPPGYPSEPPPGYPSAESGAQSPPPTDASYGMVQLRSVPDGAGVDLDGQFWLDASQMNDRWLPVTPGPHTITVRVAGRPPLERRIDVPAGQSEVVSLESFEENG